MNKFKQNRDKNKWQSELNYLLNKWDPIGVDPFDGGPKDEYGCFIKPILALLKGDKKKKELTDFLERYLEKHMGLDAKSCNVSDFSIVVYKWWTDQSWNGNKRFGRNCQ